jgi:hypothetical protein
MHAHEPCFLGTHTFFLFVLKGQSIGGREGGKGGEREGKGEREREREREEGREGLNQCTQLPPPKNLQIPCVTRRRRNTRAIILEEQKGIQGG